ncbi:Major facilitator family transporter (fragment) [Vibrio nigripulchritudo SOn1]|uniref:Major facilitator family transporter n=1 Tax=Vibrio nigripulchritudo SOn1 TaxID=1238450 RepID=A0AAV2VZK7_9VIBR
MMKILVNTEQFTQGDPIFNPLVERGYEVIVNETHRLPTEEQLIVMVSDENVVATIAGGEPYTEKVFNHSKGLKIVARWGVGYDKVDITAAAKHGIPVAMAFGCNHESVAEFAFSMATSLACNLINYNQLVKNKVWTFEDFHHGLWNHTAGVIGFGRIGRAMAERCLGAKMQVLVCDPLADKAQVEELGAKLVSFEELLEKSDLVSVHAPNTPETKHMISTRQFELMKSSAILINTSRGPLIDEEALYNALVDKQIFAAGLDVFEVEPLPLHSKLRELNNVILTPHVSGMDKNARKLVTKRCIDNILSYLDGDMSSIQPYVVNSQLLEEM